MKRVKRVYAYLINHRHYRIYFDVRRPNYEHTPVPTYDWSNTAYGNGVKTLSFSMKTLTNSYLVPLLNRSQLG